ncbi:hypothetical protein GUJ93_ZPchr0009g122 [Zizania palustris]|uniref:Reverse transcriptase domain-containing protein n=1 Tax=Zizania palustris TaxID=103762 RepID=A0A8J5UXH2_ZIZPA|nr:hypothetical protein GUJ93_ZPchr0009g122 [Zizania palustris]
MGRNVEAYMDDIVIKSALKHQHSLDLAETFERLRACEVRINPEKCIFSAKARKFLGYLVSSRGIEASPTQISALQTMAPPENLNQVQKLADASRPLADFWQGPQNGASQYLKP